VNAAAKQIEKIVEPVRASFDNLPVMNATKHATIDSMVISKSKGGEAPRIVITRN
jgi:DNA recombination-dependent growth factor C